MLTLLLFRRDAAAVDVGLDVATTAGWREECEDEEKVVVDRSRAV